VNVPTQEAPVIQVNPTPVTVTNPITIDNPITVNVPQAKKEVQTVIRDRMGNIASTETEISYEE
jgi:hypothetical protein